MNNIVFWDIRHAAAKFVFLTAEGFFDNMQFLMAVEVGRIRSVLGSDKCGDDGAKKAASEQTEVFGEILYSCLDSNTVHNYP